MSKKKILIPLVIGGIVAYFKQPVFGRLPKGSRKERVENSPNYKDGKFQNLEPKPMLSEDATMVDAFRAFMFSGNKNAVPNNSIPTIVTNLFSFKKEDNVLVWLGHSSYFMQIEGVKYLIDPVLSGGASPLPSSVRNFRGTDYYTVDKIPSVDYIIISHDHYDHLDYKTIVALKDKVKKVIMPLGVGEHFEKWGYDEKSLIELDWYEESKLQDKIKITATPAHHSSGRSVIQNKTLWASYVLETENKKIFVGGDSTYGNHFKEIGNRFGEFDLAILENGQYNEMWKYSHMFPRETLLAAKDLGAKNILPVHNSKFKLSIHDWNEPLLDITKINDEEFNHSLLTPKIGQVINLDNINLKDYERWFEEK